MPVVEHNKKAAPRRAAVLYEHICCGRALCARNVRHIISPCESVEKVGHVSFGNFPYCGQYHKAPESIVFPFAAQQVSREFKKLCGSHHLHELRHTFITRCCESGVNPSVCQQLVGHSTGDMIMNVYMHVMDEFKRKEAAKFTLFPKF